MKTIRKKLAQLTTLVIMTLLASTTAYACAVQTHADLDSIYEITEDNYIVANEIDWEEVEKMIPVNKKPDHYIVNDNGYEAKLSDDLQDHVYQMCSKYDISGYEKLIISKLYCESSYNPNAVNHNKNGTTDLGIAQINSSNHKWLRKELGITNFKDPYQSIEAGVFMMSNCLKENDYNEHMALVAYNTGKNGISQSSYSRRVMKIKNNCAIA